MKRVPTEIVLSPKCPTRCGRLSLPISAAYQPKIIRGCKITQGPCKFCPVIFVPLEWDLRKKVDR